MPAGALGTTARDASDAPDAPDAGHAALCLFGSGSAHGRDRALWQPLDAEGGLAGDARPLDLAPLYAPLTEALGGGCLFTAVAEDSADSVADRGCVGSALGRLGVGGELLWLRPLRGAPKVEGLALHVGPRGLTLCLATDADDPAVPSRLACEPRRAHDGSPGQRGRDTDRDNGSNIGRQGDKGSAKESRRERGS